MNLDMNKVVAKLQSKINKSVGHRVDIALADVKKISASDAYFMLEFNNKVPTSDEISEFFIRQFNSKITPDMATAKVHKEYGVVTVVANILSINRNFSDKEKMVPVIAGCTYFDVALDDMWEVKEVNGTKVLARKIKDDIMSIVRARKNLMHDTNTKKSFANAALASVGLLRYLAILEKGDMVNCYHEGKLVENCEVLSVSDTKAKVKVGGKEVTIPREACVEVTSKSKDKAIKEQDRVRKYFEDAYGDPEYAKKLAK